MTKSKKRDLYLRRTYGITAKQYAVMLKLQNGRCAICRAKPKTRRLHVDHSHKGEPVVRGLLCYYCNRRLVGRLTLEQAQQIVEYLSRGFDGRQIKNKTSEVAPAIRGKRQKMPAVSKEFLSSKND